MSISIPTPENLKDKAKLVRHYLKTKCAVEASHSQCLELISQLFGFKDWNTATAELSAYERGSELSPYERVKALASIRSGTREIPASISGMTVGDLRKALEPYPDSATVDADYDFNVGEFMNSIDDLQNPEDMFNQQFGITAVRKVDEGYANLMLTLKYEEFSSSL